MGEDWGTGKGGRNGGEDGEEKRISGSRGEEG